MNAALDEARRAADEGEVPVGAVVVLGERLVGRGHNGTESLRGPDGPCGDPRHRSRRAGRLGSRA